MVSIWMFPSFLSLFNQSPQLVLQHTEQYWDLNLIIIYKSLQQ